MGVFWRLIGVIVVLTARRMKSVNFRKTITGNFANELAEAGLVKTAEVVAA